MKFIANSNNLLAHMQKVSGVLVSKPVIPILDYILFDIKEGKLTMTATDLENFLITEMDVESDQNLRIAVPSRMTLDVLKQLPKQPITFSINEDDYHIELRSDFGEYKLLGENAEDFPGIPDTDSNNSFELSSSILLSNIAKTLFATSNDEIRLALSGIKVELGEEYMNFVATDANRLVKCKRTDINPGFENDFILPKKAMNLLKSTLPGVETSVYFSNNDSNAFISFGDTSLICRFVNENYPAYESVIPEENPNKMRINRLDFLSSVRRISIFSNKANHQIRLSISGSELSISAEDIEMSNEAHEKLPCEYEGQDMELGFNAKFLQEMLANIDADEISFEFSEPGKAGLIYPIGGDKEEELLMLIMPIMLQSHA